MKRIGSSEGRVEKPRSTKTSGELTLFISIILCSQEWDKKTTCGEWGAQNMGPQVTISLSRF